MKSRLARLGVLLVAVLGLMATMIPAAHADTYKLIVFTGEAELSRGLGYPGSLPDHKLPCGLTDVNYVTTIPPEQLFADLLEIPGCTTLKSGPKNEPEVNLDPNRLGGNNAGFVFNSANCVKTSVSTPDKPTPKTGVDLCTLFAAGAVSGFCGLSTGMGVATLTNTTNTLTPKQQVTTSFKFTGVGGVLHVTGGDKATNIYAEVVAIPEPNAPGGPSCTNKTADTFLLTGVAYYKDCTGPTTQGLCA